MSAIVRACTCLLAALALAGCSTPPASRADSLPAATTTPPPAAQADDEGTEAAESSENPDPAVIEANNVYFQLRSTAVDEAGKLKLREHADRLKQNPKERVTLIGHMDDLGSRNYNLAITEERLMAVNRQLRAFGVPARQIRRNRAASESSSTPCRNEACRALMRRVELKYQE
jgi:outer membrane protein OmpA-like peptidoglycan-associated protein